MKITHWGKYYPPDSGGIESVTETLARRQAASGHEVDVVCFSRHESSTSTMEGVKVHRVHEAVLLASQPLSTRYLKKGLALAKSSDVVHIHTPNMLAAAASQVLPDRCAVVVHWHSDVVGKGLLGKALRPLEVALLRRADAVIATSPPYLQSSEMLKSIGSKAQVVPIGIEPIAAEVASSSVIGQFEQFLQGRKLVLSVGRLVPYKGFDHLIEAAKELSSDVAVVIAGDGPLREELQLKIEHGGLQSRVMLAGRVSAEQLQQLFLRATLFCLPSVERSEAFGVVLLEAMSLGIPLVAANIEGSGVPWVNLHGTSGLNVPAGEGHALADACMRVVESPELHGRLARGGAERFKALFTAERFAQEVEKIYKGILRV